MAKYWFENWMKQARIRDASSLDKALDNQKSLDSLIKAYHEHNQQPLTLAGSHIVAGKGVDLTGDFANKSDGWMQNEVDDLFRHVWHYFDTIVLPDHACETVGTFLRGNIAVDGLKTQLMPIVQAVNILRKSGGMDLIRFRYRFRGCCIESGEITSPLDSDPPNLSELTKEIARTAKITGRLYTLADGRRALNYELNHPWFTHVVKGWLYLTTDQDLPSVSAETVAKDAILRFWYALGADVRAARELSAPLGSTIPFYRELLPSATQPSVSDVAFDLDLPVAQHCSIVELMRFRNDERDSFERFQASVRLAIAERINSSGAATSSEIACEIKRDIIEPELRRIRDRIKASKRLAAQTIASGVVLGTTTAAVGTLTPLSSNFIVAGAVTIGVSGMRKAIEDYLTSRRDASLSEMYFLWKAAKRLN